MKGTKLRVRNLQIVALVYVCLRGEVNGGAEIWLLPQFEIMTTLVYLASA